VTNSTASAPAIFCLKAAEAAGGLASSSWLVRQPADLDDLPAQPSGDLHQGPAILRL
jgi:hypothetical protein